MRAAALIILVAGALAAVTAVLVIVHDDGSRTAQAEPSLEVGIDADPLASPANTATSLGSIEECRQVTAGQTFDIDTFLDGIPSGRGLAGFSYYLGFDASRLEIIGQQHTTTGVNLITAAPSSGSPAYIELNEGVPDSDGSHTAVAADFGTTETNPPYSQGVLGHYTLRVLGGAPSGQASLTLTGVSVADDAGEVPVDVVTEAWVGVGEPCSPVPPTPTPTPTATPTATPTPAGTATPISTPGNLAAGWNHVCYLGPAQPIDQALADISQDIIAAYRLRPDQGYDKWFPDRPELGPVMDLSPYEALFILMAKDATWLQQPEGSAPTSMALVQGWNSVCYTGQTKAADAATAAIAGRFAIIYALAPDQPWKRFLPGQPEISTLVELVRFSALFVLVTDDAGANWAFDP